MPDRPLTLMAVHAHPDDEALFTGGILAAAADQGITTVLVTCTNGELGYGAGGSNPGEPGHDEAAVTWIRLAELEESCRILKVSHLERLGYHDSGMMGWPQNEHPDAFWNTPVEMAARRLATLMERYRPQVVVTYDADGFYGHPDHIQTHRVTLAAVERCGIPDRVFFTAVPMSAVTAFVGLAADSGMEMPEWTDGQPPFGTADERIAAAVDCTAVLDRKHAALGAHASQVDNQFFLDMQPEIFSLVFGTEMFVRHGVEVGPSPLVNDLFAGLRPGTDR